MKINVFDTVRGNNVLSLLVVTGLKTFKLQSDQHPISPYIYTSELFTQSFRNAVFEERERP